MQNENYYVQCSRETLGRITNHTPPSQNEIFPLDNHWVRYHTWLILIGGKITKYYTHLHGRYVNFINPTFYIRVHRS